MSKKIIAIMLFVPFFLFAFIVFLSMKIILYSQQMPSISSPPDKLQYWQIQSIDTMKNSRDLAREHLDNKEAPQIIDAQLKKIASSGANYVSIGTPYDAEFLPILKLWVNSARNHKLKVWFRGNWSGWEEWFDYEPIDASELITKTYDLILTNPELFADGDIFTACTECENGQMGDPRSTGGVEEYRNFLISLNNSTGEAFTKINKKVMTNFYSMNGDVAKLIMDPQTTKALGV